MSNEFDNMEIIREFDKRDFVEAKVCCIGFRNKCKKRNGDGKYKL